jgi:hypothetical protein
VAQAGAAFGHLPAADLHVSHIYPGQLTVSLHTGLGDFEAWRIALGVPHRSVRYATQSEAIRLEATVEWGGGTVVLVGYGPLSLRDVERGEAS